ncbi:MAG: cyclase family protein [Thermoplasmata archaeon]
MIDISIPYKNGLITYPGDMQYEEYEFKTHEKDHVHIMRVIMETHSGTHFDAPYHMIPDGKKANEIDLERFIGKASVIETSRKEVTDIDIPEKIEKIVLLKTPNSEKYDKFDENFTYLSLSGAKKLIQHGVKVVGIDYLSIEKFGVEPEVHKYLFRNDAVIIEGLNLKNVNPGTYDFVCLPLDMGQDGAPCRAVLL